MVKHLPYLCPACEAPLKVKTLRCEHCETEITGIYDLPMLARFTQLEQDFIIDFVKSSGSLKIMAQKLGLSYPTVRNMLDDLIQKIEKNESTNSSK